MILKLGSSGATVVALQKVLGLNADGAFGPKTEIAVKEWQAKNGLVADGIAGPSTLAKMQIATTDQSESTPTPSTKEFTKSQYTTSNGLVVNQYFLPANEYLKGPVKPEWLFLHHTAGWHDPYNTVKTWAGDTRGPIATEFVLGGPSIKGDNNQFDGELVQCFPHLSYGWHLGDNGSLAMHVNSVGIEVCNFGYVKNGLTYAGTKVDPSQVVTLAQPFRGFKEWHRYSNKQIEVLKKWILWIAERDSIDVRAGLPALIRQKGAAAFEFNEDAYYGRIKGLWTHTNTRKDKVDMFPQQELMDMLTSL
jgi:peptidoglycan hydrolase-like protein with peptidoglycan-binding domain